MKELGQQAGRPEKKLFYFSGNSSCGSNYYKKMVIQSVSCISRGGLFICAALLFILCQSPLWADGRNAVFIEPCATLNDAGTGPGTSHPRAISDFNALMENLSQKHHVNTVILNLDSTSYKWEFDQTMGNLYYQPARGFTKAEIREMVTYARNWGMEVFIALATITHQNSQGQALSRAYPQYMLPEPAWGTGQTYGIYSFVEVDGQVYRSLANDTYISAASNNPVSGADRDIYWIQSYRHLRDPYNEAGDAKFFGMIDDAIDAATVNGVKPDGVHLCGDEGVYFNERIGLQNGDTVAVAYARGFINAYNHIKNNHPGMKIAMWGDMLDANLWGTSDAIDLIPKDIIICDWRYERNSQYGYDPAQDEFPSVRMFAKKGFTVWPTSWMFEDAARSLVKTGNTVSDEGGSIYGHIYAPWDQDALAELKNALDGTGSPSPMIIACANTLKNSISNIHISTVYENAEDGYTDGWLSYPTGAFANIYDSDRGNRVIQFTGDGLNSHYRLNKTGTWSASGNLSSTQFVFEWSHKFSEDFKIYLDVNTSAGQRYIDYTAADTDYLGTGQYVHHGLGAASKNGTWQTFERDAEADLQEAQPGVVLYEINNIIVAGSGCVDDIKLITGDTIYENAEDANIDGWLSYPSGAIANVSDSGRNSRVIQFTGDGLNSHYRLNKTGTWSASGNLSSTQFVFEWSHKFSEDFKIYLDVNTSAGQRYIYYGPDNTDYLGAGQYVHHGLGAASKNGTWQTFERDAEADLQEAQPGVVLYEINNIIVAGSGSVDDIKLRDRSKFTATHWKFDEGNGSSVAATARYANITGTASNTSWVYGVDGQSNHALNFDGSTSYINIPNNDLFTVSNDGVTFSAWIKPSSLSSAYNMVLCHGSGHCLSLCNGYVCFKIITGGVEHCALSSSALTVNTWYHIAGSYDRSGLKVFINGRQNGSTSGAFLNPDSNINSFAIGKSMYNSSYFNGIIDDVQICRKGSTDEEIRKLKDSAVIAYSLPLNEGAGTTAYDNFDRSRQAIITGATWQDKALYFDGVDDYVTIAGSDTAFKTDGSNGFTFAAWIKSDGAFPAEHDAVFLKGNAYLSIYNGKLRFKILTDSATQRYCIGSTALTPNAWHHVAAVYDASGNMKVYLDGVQDGSTVGPYLNHHNEAAYTIMLGRTWSNYSKGIISNARIYKRGLTADEINLLYQNKE